MFLFLTLTIFWVSTKAVINVVINTCPAASTFNCPAYSSSYGDTEVCCYSQSVTGGGGSVQKYANQCYFDCQSSSAHYGSYYCGKCCSTNPNEVAIDATLACDSTTQCTTQSGDTSVTDGYCRGSNSGSTTCGQSNCDPNVLRPCGYLGADLECLQDASYPATYGDCFVCTPTTTTVTTKAASDVTEPATTKTADATDPATTGAHTGCTSINNECSTSTATEGSSCNSNAGTCEYPVNSPYNNCLRCTPLPATTTTAPDTTITSPPFFDPCAGFANLCDQAGADCPARTISDDNTVTSWIGTCKEERTSSGTTCLVCTPKDNTATAEPTDPATTAAATDAATDPATTRAHTGCTSISDPCSQATVGSDCKVTMSGSDVEVDGTCESPVYGNCLRCTPVAATTTAAPDATTKVTSEVTDPAVDPCASFRNRCQEEDVECTGQTLDGGTGTSFTGKCRKETSSAYDSRTCLVCSPQDTTAEPSDTATTKSDETTAAATDGATTKTATDAAETSTTSSPNCDTDRYPFYYARQLQCDDANPGGCRLVVSIDAEVCSINGWFSFWKIQRIVRRAIRAVANGLDTSVECDLEDVCGIDLDIQRIASNVNEADADARGSFKPTTLGECPDLDEYCGADGSKPQFDVSIDVGLNCGTCLELEDLKDAFMRAYAAGTVKTGFESNAVVFSTEEGDVCGVGFRNVRLVSDLKIALEDADGTVLEEVTVDLDDVLKSNVSHHGYYIGAIAVLAMLSFFY